VGKQQEPCDSSNDGIMGVLLFSVVSCGMHKLCVPGSIFSLQTWGSSCCDTGGKQTKGKENGSDL